MYIAYLAGGLACGKSTVARELEGLGALRLDLDAISREVLLPHAPATAKIATIFGEDLLDPDSGLLDRHELARRAFVTPEATAQLEAAELPFIAKALKDHLDAATQLPNLRCCIVEVPLLDRMESLVSLADEVVCVCCPAGLRLERAIARGMDAADARARIARQPSEDYLRTHADTIFDSSGSLDELMAQVHAWWDGHVRDGWSVCSRVMGQ